MVTQDTTAIHPTRPTSRLVVAPHSGDEVLGCGGMLAKHFDDAMVVFLADSDEDRQGQIRTAHRLLGGPGTTCLGLPAGHLADDLDRVVGLLAELISHLRPTAVYLPYPLAHPDHLVAYEAGMRVTRTPEPGSGRSQISVLLYSPDALDPQDYPADIRWSVCEPLVAEDIDRKVAAAMAYRSPLARSLKQQAKSVGSIRHLPWAEQYALVRSAQSTGRRHDLAPAAAPDLASVVR